MNDWWILEYLEHQNVKRYKYKTSTIYEIGCMCVLKDMQIDHIQMDFHFLILDSKLTTQPHQLSNE